MNEFSIPRLGTTRPKNIPIAPGNKLFRNPNQRELDVAMIYSDEIEEFSSMSSTECCPLAGYGCAT
jgi:hypothetical protein